MGEVGELWFRGPHVSRGYWNRPEETAAAYLADGWFRSGDLARRDEEGFFYIAGRQKEMLISGGVNVYPAEIESALLQHPGVRDAAVVGVEHPTWGEVGVAFVVPLAPGSAEASASSPSSPSGWRATSCRTRSSPSPSCRGRPTARWSRASSSAATRRSRAGEAHRRRTARPPARSAPGPPVVFANGGMMSFPAWEPVARRSRRPFHPALRFPRPDCSRPASRPPTSPATPTISPRCSTPSAGSRRTWWGPPSAPWSRSPSPRAPGSGCALCCSSR